MPTLSITGMSCQHCVASTQKALEGIAGVSDVKVNLEKNEAVYEGDVNIEEVKDVVRKIGFTVN